MQLVSMWESWGSSIIYTNLHAYTSHIADRGTLSVAKILICFSLFDLISFLNQSLCLKDKIFSDVIKPIKKQILHSEVRRLFANCI